MRSFAGFFMYCSQRRAETLIERFFCCDFHFPPRHRQRSNSKSHVARGKLCAKSSGFRLVYPMIGNEQRIVFRLKKASGKGRENSISLSAGLGYFPFFFLSPQRYMPYDDVNENGRKNNTQRCKAYPKPLVKIAESISNTIFT